ncbi:hypothetical protein [Nocardia sp. alder85J]|uniref:hypothetical protein n=1 Tax=Nocardia sp. alder85J TaxID=2862949 RepID=UPI001CD56CA6|nr:hypothetical protein [Nocardia sp. alder85J]MCX4093052.1 hypothetical protein [Nocardia sp. alder85J]
MPVMLDGQVIGVLWASKGGNAAAYQRRTAVDPDKFTRPEFWENRLDEGYRRGLPAEDAVRSWVGVDEDPRMGGVPAGTRLQEIGSEQLLWEWLNPGAPPLEEGPWIQDGEFPDGTPEDRSKGWTVPVSLNESNYASSTDTTIHYFPVTRGGPILGYLWASATEAAAGYIARPSAGVDGIRGRGLWIARLQDCHRAGRTALEAVRWCAAQPADEYAGVIEPGTPEQSASSPTELTEIAGR